MSPTRSFVRAVGCTVFAVLLWSGCETPQAVSTGDPQEESLSSLELATRQADRPLYVPGEVVVKFRAGATESQRGMALQRVQGAIEERIVTRTMRSWNDNEGITRLSVAMDVSAAVVALRSLPGVEYAEPNYYYYHDAVSNDPYYTNGSLWGMYGDATSPANQYGSQAGEAWAAGNTGSSTVLVGVIDEGVMHAHTDLSANIWINPFDPVDGVDNDGNGYVDDKYGWDFNGNNNSTYDGTSDDHGTHVAGTIGAKGGNGTGVAGVAWNVKMITAKFLGPSGGTTTNAIKAVDYITDLKTRHGLNIVATNNSWGGGGFSQALKDAIDRAGTANILFVAAAGNGGGDGIGDNNDAVPHYPSSYSSSNIIAVASITSTGARSSFSNYGAVSVDLGAPGSGIYSTLPGSRNRSLYGSYSGTSMATPHVTGGVVLYAAKYPGSSAATIKNAILSSTVATSSMSGITVSGGRLNVSGF